MPDIYEREVCGTSYTPLFYGIVLSSVWMEPMHVLKVWIGLLAAQNRKHCVPLSAYQLAELFRMDQALVDDALKVLSGPDDKRPGQPKDGRRIVWTPGGWQIVRGEDYQKLMNRINANARAARYLERRRQRAKDDKNTPPHDMEMPRTTAECERAEMRAEVQERKDTQ